MTIIDTSVWIALFNKKDTTHERAVRIVQDLNTNEVKLFDYIHAETLTVLRNKISNSHCYTWLQCVKNWNIEISMTDKTAYIFAEKLFLLFQKLSFTDCLLLATTKLNKSKLLTFDKELQKAYRSL